MIYNNNNNNNYNYYYYYIIRCCEHLNSLKHREHDDVLTLSLHPTLLGYVDGVKHRDTIFYCWTLSLV